MCVGGSVEQKKNHFFCFFVILRISSTFLTRAEPFVRLNWCCCNEFVFWFEVDGVNKEQKINSEKLRFER